MSTLKLAKWILSCLCSNQMTPARHDNATWNRVPNQNFYLLQIQTADNLSGQDGWHHPMFLSSICLHQTSEIHSQMYSVPSLHAYEDQLVYTALGWYRHEWPQLLVALCFKRANISKETQPQIGHFPTANRNLTWINLFFSLFLY